MSTERKTSPHTGEVSDVEALPPPHEQPKGEPEFTPQPDEWDEETGHTPARASEEPERKRVKTGRAPRFDDLKSFKGQRYTGMAIGGSHHWTYESGQWDETKEEPDLWKIKFEARKHRQRHAPKGSGAPVGTEYHWLIVAHQYVVKEDKDTYSTRMEGRKYKLAHKSVGSNAWSINTVRGQREREIALLEDAKARVQGLAPVIGSQKVSSLKRKEPGQRTLEQTIEGGARRKAEPEATKAETSPDESE